MTDDGRYETGMESDPMDSSERYRPPRYEEDDDGDGIDPDNLAEWEDSDGDQWRSYVDGKHIIVCCTDGVEGEEIAWCAICPEDLAGYRRFLKAIHTAYSAIPDEMKEELRRGYR